jgi:hypothetical protein
VIDAAPGPLSTFDIQRLILALGWTRDDRPFRDSDIEAVAVWAELPMTSPFLVASVLRGDTAIDVAGGKVRTWPRKPAEAKRLKRALKHLALISR